MVAEPLTADLTLALDPVRFAHRTGLEPDPWQARLLRSGAQQFILNCSRQAGKSTCTARLGLHEALYQPPGPILLLSPSLRQSQELFRKVKEALAPLDYGAGLVVEESALRLEFENGARIISLPGQEATIRGYSGVRLLLVDEASRVPDALYQAVRPMLAVSGGRIGLLSSPFGKRGFFYEVWTGGDEDWERIEVTAEQCPRISPEWLAKERAAIGDWWYAQEYGCQFVDTIDQVFASVHVEKALDRELQPLFGGLL